LLFLGVEKAASACECRITP